MSVKIIRLVNNEEVIGEIEHLENGNYSIRNGAVIIPAGEGRMALVPWLPHAEENEIEISADRVMFTFTPLSELANEYNSRLGNGLVVPSGAGPDSIPNLRLSDD